MTNEKRLAAEGQARQSSHAGFWLACVAGSVAVALVAYALADRDGPSIRDAIAAAFGIGLTGAAIAVIWQRWPRLAAIGACGVGAGLLELALGVAGTPGQSVFAALPIDLIVCLVLAVVASGRRGTDRVRAIIAAPIVGALALGLAWEGAVLFMGIVFPAAA